MQKEQLEPAAAIEPKQKTMDERVAISLAVSRYVRALSEWEEVGYRLNEASRNFRLLMNDVPYQFITKIDFENYLVVVNSHGSFRIEKIETI